MYALAQELRFAFRQLWKAPGVSLTVVLTLAVGIGACLTGTGQTDRSGGRLDGS